MHKCSNDSNSNCDHCGLTEDLFIKCSIMQKVCTSYQPILTKLIGKTYTLQQHLLTLNVKNTNKDTKKLTRTVIQIILFEIRQFSTTKGKNLLPQHTIISKINAQLQNIVQPHCKNTNQIIHLTNLKINFA